MRENRAMHFKTNVKYSVPLFLLMATKLVSSTEQQMSMWQTTVNHFTAVAKDLGVDQANEPCKEFLKDDNTCMEKWRVGKLWREVEREEKIYCIYCKLLECNRVDHQLIDLSEVSRICQLKAWFVILIIIIIVINCLIILGCVLLSVHVVVVDANFR